MTTETELAEYAERVHMEAELNEWIEHTVIKKSLGQMTQSEEEILDSLQHHGVKGQRWGVRRKSKAVAPKSDIPDVKKMSNEDLKAAVARLQLEKQFKDLTNANKPKSAGGQFVKGILKDVGKQKTKELLIAGIGAAASGLFFARSIMKD